MRMLSLRELFCPACVPIRCKRSRHLRKDVLIPLFRPSFMPSDMLKILTLIALLMASATCNAGAFSVTPVRLFFDPRDKAVAITLTNDGDEEVVLQADVYQWTQNLNGLDKTEPTEDLIVSPPSLRLPPRSRQVVRLGLLIPRDRARQMTYRLLVREIPEAVRRKDATLQLPIALVLNMSVFITPSGASRKIDCGWEKGEGAKPSLSCMNTGAAYAQVRSAESAARAFFWGKQMAAPTSWLAFAAACPCKMQTMRPWRRAVRN